MDQVLQAMKRDLEGNLVHLREIELRLATLDNETAALRQQHGHLIGIVQYIQTFLQQAEQQGLAQAEGTNIARLTSTPEQEAALAPAAASNGERPKDA
jgi:hypothetical protein